MLPSTCSNKDSKTLLLTVLLLMCSSIEKVLSGVSQKLCVFSVLVSVEGLTKRAALQNSSKLVYSESGLASIGTLLFPECPLASKAISNNILSGI